MFKIIYTISCTWRLFSQQTIATEESSNIAARYFTNLLRRPPEAISENGQRLR
jgi:hypothetical protein